MAQLVEQPVVMAGEGWDDYTLVDSGEGRKLEQFGPYRFIRPEPQAMWSSRFDQDGEDWQADGEFIPGADEDGGGRWQLSPDVPEEGWPLAWRETRFTAHNTPFRHLGFFPDMAPVWDWMRSELAGTPDASTMNLFGYTGVGTLLLSDQGAKMVHVDASKKSVEGARRNAQASGMAERPIRWLVEDAAKFTAREVRRERRYDGILLDPPKFGRGPTGETWRLEEGLPDLLANCVKLLDQQSKYLVLTVYAVRMSALAIGELMQQLTRHLGGTVECGEMAMREERRGLLLPTAIFARWSKD